MEDPTTALPPQNDPLAEKFPDNFGKPKPYTQVEKRLKKKDTKNYGVAWRSAQSFKNQEHDRRRKLLRRVGKGRVIPPEYQDDPQTFLQYTHHPYAPFTGDTLFWHSFAWDDAATYEGLTRDMVPHGHGVFVVGHRGVGAGMPNAREGDVYSGEFRMGFADGVGEHVAASGEVYRGEFTAGERDGCGMMYNLRPLHGQAARRAGGRKAKQQAEKQVLDSVTLGTWQMGAFVSHAQEDAGAKFCNLPQVQHVLLETDNATSKAKMFEHMPYGDAAFYKHHSLGAPIRSMQHPLHYPHNTLFMAPGPVGLTQAIPNDPELRSQMYKFWHNYRAVHDLYNFDVEPEPGTVQADALLYGRTKERVFCNAPIWEVADYTDAIYDVDGIPITERVPENVDIDQLDPVCKPLLGDWTFEDDAEQKHRDKVDYLLEKQVPPDPFTEQAAGGGGQAAAPRSASDGAGPSSGGYSQPFGQEDFDEEDLVADASAVAARPSGHGRSGTPPASAFGSATLSRQPRRDGVHAQSQPFWQRLQQWTPWREPARAADRPRIASSGAVLPAQQLPQLRSAAAPLRFGMDRSRGRLPAQRAQE